jgi:ketosteroid isomerase-like protein
MPGESSQSNREVAVSWASALFQGDGRRFHQLSHPDFRTVMIGDMAMAGDRNLDEFLTLMQTLRSEHFAPGPYQMTIGSITAEDDRVCLEAESSIPLRNGRTYNNHYMWVIVIKEGKVIRLKEIMDTLHVSQVFDGQLVEGQPGPRVNRLFDQPSVVIEGIMAPPR